ncbi:hypothetical protein [Antribacter gilvus]|uniref:hypothetical protein n=1 Tax=Antribacter gilvus TaxID=2304675 RepID=UPI000F786DD6|nr:hypothetical protein [Antribacter gilvus]
MSTHLRPIARAARAAYTRPGSTILFERRHPARRAYWTAVARRALTAALDLTELTSVLAAHQITLPLDNCSCGAAWFMDYRTHTAHQATALLAHVLGETGHDVEADR